jgi:DNA phosphorothioation-dependent restriction protein DptF
MLTFRSALSVLSKSSPFAVRTVSDWQTDESGKLKNWLFVRQPIEDDFQALLRSLAPDEMLFLCGSSGDGKSEILVRYYAQYKDKVRFHLDATHSFAPQQSAIQALDELFDKVKCDDKPLVLGVNVGMLANYGKEGAERHDDIKAVIERFLRKHVSEKPYYFLDFEQYPKFGFGGEAGTYSLFVKALMQRLAEHQDENPFYQLAQQADRSGADPQLVANYRLLAREEVQETIIRNLFEARLFKEQFTTTRSLLDFLHHLLVGNASLADNLFGGSENELVQRIAEFDPALRHTKALDQFVLSHELGLADPELEEFLGTLLQQRLLAPTDCHYGAVTLIRLFFLLKGCSIGNNYHHRFSADFEDELLPRYARVWSLHHSFDGSPPMVRELRQQFYAKMIRAIYRYANRNAPHITDGELFLGRFGDILLAAPIELKLDLNALPKVGEAKCGPAKFHAHLRVGEVSLAPIPINLNLFALLDKLDAGYRPNKYDKNTIVFLDDVIEQIAEVANQSPTLNFYEGEQRYRAKLEDDIIEVNGLA